MKWLEMTCEDMEWYWMKRNMEWHVMTLNDINDKKWFALTWNDMLWYQMTHNDLEMTWSDKNWHALWPFDFEMIWYSIDDIMIHDPLLFRIGTKSVL